MSNSRFVRFAVAALALVALSAPATALAAPALPQQASSVAKTTALVCPGPAGPGTARCHAIIRTDIGARPNATTGTPSGYAPADLQSAYAVPTSNGSGATVAIVDAYDDPNAEADLGTYRSQYGVAACTTANGCFQKVNQSGGSTMPSANSSWSQEISLDLDMVSAICPNCKILLVEANSNSYSDLGTAVKYAAGHANAVSNSYGGGEFSSETNATYDGNYTHSGVAITVSSGDNGYGVEYPAASQYVTAVGGTSLSRDSSAPRGWSETVWSGAGSGCSAYETKPTWQTDSGCSRRTVADVSAIADPNTGVAVYDSYANQGVSGWLVFGGTSVASPIVASVYALAGSAGSSDTLSSYPYQHYPNGINDVASGSNGSCGGSYLCTGEPKAYDGPSGLGTPNGTSAFVPAAAKLSVSSIVPVSGPTSGGTNVTISGSAFAAGATVAIGGVAATNVNVSSASTIAATTAAHAAGAADVVVTNSDGTTATLAGAFTYGLPAVSSINPTSGSTAGGTSVTISGGNFASGATVTIGGAAATNVSVSNGTTIKATTPAHAAGAADVVVTNPDGASATLAGGFTYAAVALSSISPNTGPTVGATGVTISGSNFASGATVSIGGLAATNVSLTNSTTMTATTPAHGAGPADLVVNNPDGTSATLAGAFTYAAPSVGAITPNSGSTAGGTKVTISGGNFASGATVTFGGTAATNVSVTNSTTITATTPAHAAGAVDVVVANSDGTSGTLAGGFTYAAPVVSSISPNTGSTVGGTNVTISGSNFGSGATVSFGGVAATGVSVTNSTTITATTPAHAAGVVDVVVTNSDGTSAKLTGGYTFVAPPDFTISPNPSTGITVSRSSSASETFTFTGLNSYSSTVSLSLTGLPRNTSYKFNPASVSLSSQTPSGTSILTISATHKATAGSYQLTLVASGNDGTTHREPITLTIQ